jgi:hypothetical protein
VATELRARGLRNPRHDFYHAVETERVQPIFACPVRPRETVVGWRLKLEVALSEAVKLCWAPYTDIEVGVWKVPISTLGEHFADMFVADFEDSGGGNFGASGGPLGSGVLSSTNTPAFDGHLSPSVLHNRTRTWAGELAGQVDAAVRDNARSYVPYVSAATYHVARSYYELELETGFGDRNQADLWNLPPKVSSKQRGMTASSIGANLQDDQIPTGGVAEWAERLSLLSRRNRTYAEYLQGFGVPLDRVRSLPEPLMVKRFTLDHDWKTTSASFDTNIGSAALPWTGTNGGFNGYTGYNVRRLDDIGGVAPVMHGAIMDSGAGMIHGEVDLTRKRRIMIDEPSIILGTIVVYDNGPNQVYQDHVADISRLISGALWGDSNSDEIDFITSQQLPGAMNMNRSFGAGTPNFPATNPGFAERNPDGQLGPYVMNALNLFLNGDRWSNDNWAFRFLPQLCTLIAPVDPTVSESLIRRSLNDVSKSLQISVKGRYQHGVATELVG